MQFEHHEFITFQTSIAFMEFYKNFFKAPIDFAINKHHDSIVQFLTQQIKK